MRQFPLSAALTVLTVAAVMSFPALSSPAEARGHHHQYRHHYRGHHYSHYGQHRRHHAVAARHACPRRHCGSLRAAWRGHRGASHYAMHSPPGLRANSRSLGSVGGTLAAKAHEIVAKCGSTVISAFRRGARIAGTGHASMHASGRAVDIRGNPGCIYAHLHGWSGGYSTDYGSVQHVHISLGGHEDGQRFSHHRSSRHSRARHGWHRAGRHA